MAGEHVTGDLGDRCEGCGLQQSIDRHSLTAVQRSRVYWSEAAGAYLCGTCFDRVLSVIIKLQSKGQ